MLLLTRKNRIKELCKSSGMTMEELANQLFVSSSTVSQWANGKRPPFDSTKWKEIADIFNVRIDYVMGLDRIDPEHYYEEEEK
ncbi:helix-turn-helix domain-containing protein [Limosilactobacillus reuteri]|uniref:helix-turn-helix domain-containing protein n=1 Tax=Limosilactobacillus reuteri TaxID=1598 RepID=UPI00214B823B|nr:helix-turn-helix transcriptional regulator [Limosilactobacillus reuteri]MCR1879389.1 helix-turn-helix domain-containing protein [Limosilactobacillus reuteri]